MKERRENGRTANMLNRSNRQLIGVKFRSILRF
nr:MAG TPA: hypothetical protein [Caudoviricetes sp.]